MSMDYQYPAELFLNPLSEELSGEDLAVYNKAFFSLLNDFDSLNAIRERRLIQRGPEDYWRYVKSGRFQTEAEMQQFITAVIQRFKSINAYCKRLKRDDFFPHPEEVVSSYFLRDVMMCCVPAEEAAQIIRARDEILSEFQSTGQSSTLRQIVGKFVCRRILRRYRIT